MLIGLAVIFLLLFVVKHVYFFLASPMFAGEGMKLPGFVESLLEEWAVLDLLWRAIPPWQPTPAVPTTPRWDSLYGLCGALVVGGLGGFLLRSAQNR